VAIYLDANILWPWRTFEELDRLALSIVANQIGQKVFVPEIAAREAQETYRRSLQSAVNTYTSAVDDLGRQFRQEFCANVNPYPSVADATDAWRDRLGLLAEVLPTNPDDVVQALEREIVGRPPAKPRVGKGSGSGSGGRDAAIWLSVLRHHRVMGEPGILVSKDGGAFGVEGSLKRELREELAGCEHELTLYSGLEALIAKLGQATPGPGLTVQELRALAEPTLKDALKHRPDVPPAYWGRLEPHLRYATCVRSAQPVQIREQRTYKRENDAISLVDADWELSVQPCFQDIDTDMPDAWSCLEGPVDVVLAARIQMFVPEQKNTSQRAELITGRWSSRTTLFTGESGKITAWTKMPLQDVGPAAHD
jgi:hypothetical protein